MADQKMGSWPVFRNNSVVEQKLMAESSVTKSSNKSLSLKEEGNYHKTKTAFWGRHAAPSCTHLPEAKAGCAEVFLSFPLNASWYPALSFGGLVLFKAPSDLRLCPVLECFDSGQLSGDQEQKEGPAPPPGVWYQPTSRQRTLVELEKSGLDFEGGRRRE